MTILSARAVADMLGMTRHHLNSMAAAGEIPAVKVAGKWVFIEEDVVAWLKERMIPKPVEAPRKVGRPRKRVV